MSASSELDSSVADRKQVERAMGARWNDVVFRAISREVLDRIELEERLYGQRLRDLERINSQSRRRLADIRAHNSP